MGRFASLLPGMVLAWTLAVSAAVAADKLATDDAVRREMKAIRDLTLNVHTLVTHRRMPPADARTYHARVKAAVERLRTETTLDGGERDEIENLTQDILAGAEAIGRSPSSTEAIDGIVAIDEALARYAKQFDHPGWQPLR
jgi:hypothetical protein